MQQASFSLAKLMQTVRLTQIARMDTIEGRVIVYTQPLDTAAFRIAAAKRWSPPTPSLHTVPSSSSAEDSPTATTTGGEWTSAREARNLSASGLSGMTAKVSDMPSPEKPPLLPPKKDKAQVLPSSLPNESALVTYSEDDSDANETFHDAETIPDKAHAPMPPSPLSPRRTRVSSPNLSVNSTSA